jgi:hypothetical protein
VSGTRVIEYKVGEARQRKREHDKNDGSDSESRR